MSLAKHIQVALFWDREAFATGLFFRRQTLSQTFSQPGGIFQSCELQETECTILCRTSPKPSVEKSYHFVPGRVSTLVVDLTMWGPIGSLQQCHVLGVVLGVVLGAETSYDTGCPTSSCKDTSMMVLIRDPVSIIRWIIVHGPRILHPTVRSKHKRTNYKLQTQDRRYLIRNMNKEAIICFVVK